MGHLVKPILYEVSIAECYRDVKEAHDYLSVQGAKAIELASGAAGSPQWGSRVKRLNVSLPQSGRPLLIDVDVKKFEHNLTEVMNQCATIERLLDTLMWAQADESGLAQFRVVSCHPTTSSTQVEGKKPGGDNDLVLMSASGQHARFEISDIVSDRDGNGKEEKDLRSLDVWRKGIDQELRTDWPAGRIFLVVSQNFAPRLHRAKRLWLRYDMVWYSEQTCIFEIKPT